jgi:hypothetical protein
MLYFLSGVVVTGAGAGGLWYCRPRNGQINPLAMKPGLDFVIPIGIVSAIAIGLALIVSGVMN